MEQVPEGNPGVIRHAIARARLHTRLKLPRRAFFARARLWLISSWHNYSRKIRRSFGCIICIVLGVNKDKLPLGCLSLGYQVFISINKAVFNRSHAITSTRVDFISPGLRGV